MSETLIHASRAVPTSVPVVVVAALSLLSATGTAVARGPVGTADGIFGDEFSEAVGDDALESGPSDASGIFAPAPSPAPAPPGLPAFQVDPGDAAETADAPSRHVASTRRSAAPAANRPARVDRTVARSADQARVRGAASRAALRAAAAQDDDRAATVADVAVEPAATPSSPLATAFSAAGVLGDCLTEDPLTGRTRLDPACVLDRLRERYLSLVDHREAGWLVEEYDVAGRDEPQRTETRVECEIDRGTVRVTTPARQMAGGLLGRLFPIRVAPLTAPATSAVNEWIAPHAALGDRDGSIDLPAAAAGSVTLEDRSMVRLDLEEAGDRVELFVNPDTMLVEFVRERRSLPGGRTYRAELDIQIESTSSSDDRASVLASDAAPESIVADAVNPTDVDEDVTVAGDPRPAP